MQHMRVQENNCLGGLYLQRHQDYHLINEHQIASESHIIDCVRKKRLGSASTNMASIDYSIKEQDSLHSEFSYTKIQETQQNKNALMESQSQCLVHLMPSFVKTHSPHVDCQQQKQRSAIQEDNLTNPLQIEQKSQEDKDSYKKNKFHNDSSKISSQKGMEQQPIEKRKSYMSSLHEIVDRNHLQSPSHKLMMRIQDEIEFENFTLEHDPNSQQKTQEKQPQNNEKRKQQYRIQQKKQNIINPVLIKQKADENEKKQSSNSSKQSPRHKLQHNNRVQIRRIPSNLYQSYDELVLSINENQKPMNKSPLDSPIKLKVKPNIRKESSNDSKQIDELKTHQDNRQKKVRRNKKDQELLVNLPVVEGFCIIFGENGKETETKFVINKNEILFQNEFKIMISQVSKIKLVNKDDKQLTIKLSYDQTGSKKSETIVLGFYNPLESTYFRRTYQLYSEIILRKLLLMKLSINEVNEKIEAGSYVKSCQSSPTNSPILAPKSIKLIGVQKNEPTSYGAQLFRKGVIFSSWQKKYFSLSANSFQCFPSAPVNGQKFKPQSSLQKTTQIWTRFQLTYGYLVIKLWQNKLEKIQIGIPLCDFANTQGLNNWLYGLSNYILWGKR